MNQPARRQQQQRKLQPSDIPAYLQTDAGQQKIRQYAPDSVDADEIKRVGLWLLNNGPDKLQQCDVGQIIEAILQAFHTGIDLTRGEGHLVPYPPTVDFRIDYKGLVRLAQEGTDVTVDADVVREGDEIRKWRDEEGLHFRHECDLFGDSQKIGVYAIIHKGGQLARVEVMGRDDLEKAADQSGNPHKSGKQHWSGAWRDWFWEMSKKTVLRRALKTVDTRPAVDRVLTREQRERFSDDREGDTSGHTETDTTDLNATFSPDTQNDNVQQLPQGQQGGAQRVDDQPERDRQPQPAQTQSGGQQQQQSRAEKLRQDRPSQSEPRQGGQSADSEQSKTDQRTSLRRSLSQKLRHLDVDVDRETVETGIAAAESYSDADSIPVGTLKYYVEAIKDQGVEMVRELVPEPTPQLKDTEADVTAGGIDALSADSTSLGALHDTVARFYDKESPEAQTFWGLVCDEADVNSPASVSPSLAEKVSARIDDVEAEGVKARIDDAIYQ